MVEERSGATTDGLVGPALTVASDQPLPDAVAGGATADARLRIEAARHQAWRDGVTRILAAVVSGRDRCDVLTEVAAAARTLAAADLALVIGPRPRRPTAGVLAADGAAGCRLVGLPARQVEPRCGLVGDVSRDPPVSRMPRMGAGIAVPLAAAEGPGQTLWVLNAPRRPPFDEADWGLVKSLGEHAAALLAATRPVPPGPHEDVRRLHDHVVQTLFGIGMEMQGAAELTGDRQLAARLRAAAEGLDRVMERLRAHDRGAL